MRMTMATSGTAALVLLLAAATAAATAVAADASAAAGMPELMPAPLQAWLSGAPHRPRMPAASAQDAGRTLAQRVCLQEAEVDFCGGSWSVPVPVPVPVPAPAPRPAAMADGQAAVRQDNGRSLDSSGPIVMTSKLACCEGAYGSGNTLRGALAPTVAGECRATILPVLSPFDSAAYWTKAGTAVVTCTFNDASEQCGDTLCAETVVTAQTDVYLVLGKTEDERTRYRVTDCGTPVTGTGSIISIIGGGSLQRSSPTLPDDGNEAVIVTALLGSVTSVTGTRGGDAVFPGGRFELASLGVPGAFGTNLLVELFGSFLANNLRLPELNNLGYKVELLHKQAGY